MPFLDIHAIQSVPPANINRDENGSPKTAIYGGVRRLRVSSQAWKRASRRALEAASGSFQESQRTKRLPEILADDLMARVPDLGDEAKRIAEAAVTAVFGVKTAKKSDRVATDYLLFFGTAQRERLADLLAKRHEDALELAGNPKKLAKELGLRDAVENGHPPAVALFGRMIATDPTLNVDAACQVAHAISTHGVESEFDYYTAVDDVDSAADETGAGMIGTIEFNAATMYRYATVDLRSLAENLDGEVGFAADTAVEFARAFLLSMPTGKRTTFAHNTRPDFALLSVREDQPVSLVGAFERPLTCESGLTAPSIGRLVAYHAQQDELYGTKPVLSVASYPKWVREEAQEWAGADRKLPVSRALPEAFTSVRAELARLIGATDA